jgi:serine O-acetyltransferase
MQRDTLSDLYDARPRLSHPGVRRAQAGKFFEGLYSVLFGPESSRCETKGAFESRLLRVEADLMEMLEGVGLEHDHAVRTTERFFQQLARTCRCLAEDAEFIRANDPACHSVSEVILAYPGFYAIAAYRVGHILSLEDVPTLPRLITEHAHEWTGVDIHPAAEIGCPFFIDHGTGVVIGETTRIGDRVKVYQGVTLGALSVKKELAQERRHPTIGDDVVLYASATVLGGDTFVGAGSVIGGNVWLTESVPARSLVYHKSTVRIRQPEEPDDGLEFHI